MLKLVDAKEHRFMRDAARAALGYWLVDDRGIVEEYRGTGHTCNGLFVSDDGDEDFFVEDAQVDAFVAQCRERLRRKF